MPKSRDALGLVLAGLRRLMAEGAIAPGATVSIGDVADRFRVSVTPVREALARLAGEGLLRSTRRFGYERPAPAAEELRQLYAFRQVLLLAAVQLTAAQRRNAPPAGAETPSEFFQTWVAATDNAPLIRTYLTNALLLAPAGAVEAEVLGGLSREAEALREACAGPDDARLEVVIRTQHARRSAAAAQLAERLRAAAGLVMDSR